MSTRPPYSSMAEPSTTALWAFLLDGMWAWQDDDNLPLHWSHFCVAATKTPPMVRNQLQTKTCPDTILSLLISAFNIAQYDQYLFVNGRSTEI